MAKKKVLILSHDKIGTQMAGPGIRYHYVGEVLSEYFDVTIGFFGPDYLPDEAFQRTYKVKHIDVNEYQKPFLETDYIFTLWLNDAMIQFCNQHKKVVIFDIYAPVPVETLAVQIFSRKTPTPEVDYDYNASLKMYRKFLENGDQFVVSNRRQLDFWQGFVFGFQDITPSSYLKDPVLDRFLVAPMGIDTTQKMEKHRQLYKGVIKNIKKDDLIVIWNGGIYDWYDSATLIDAMKLLWDQNHRHIKLVFPGIKHPNPSTPKWSETRIAIEKAQAYGLTDKTVFFFDSWFNFHERLEYLLEADMAVYTHQPSIEAEFSHRSRMIDHILTLLPTVASDGDHFADVIAQNGLGKVVAPQNAQELAKALVDLSQPAELAKARKNLEALRPTYDWHETLKPLVAYLLSNPKKRVRIQKAPAAPLETPRLATLKRVTPKPIKRLAKRVLKKLRN